MPRGPRVDFPGAVHHVYARGIEKRPIYLDDADRKSFLDRIGKNLPKWGMRCLAWSLMPNHWHGIFRCPPSGLSEFMQRLNHRYALRFDRRWGRTAHVFDNRFGAVLQQTEEQFLTTLRYVMRNPVTAGICSSPFDARWTSFPATIGIVPAPEYLRTREILEHFGDDPVHARERFIAFVAGDSPAVEGPSSEPPTAWGTIAA